MPLPAHVANEIARLMRDPDALRHERGRMPPFGRRGHYDPSHVWLLGIPMGASGRMPTAILLPSHTTMNGCNLRNYLPTVRQYEPQ